MGRFALAIVAAVLASSAEAAVIEVGSAPAQVGAVVVIPVTLAAEGAEAAGVQIDVAYPPGVAEVVTRENGRPDCAVNPDIEKNDTGFSFRPSGCRPGIDCDGIRALVLANDNVDPIADGLLFTCRVEVLLSTGQPMRLRCGNPGLSAPDGGALLATCTSGAIFIGPSPTPAETPLPPTPTPTRTETRTATATAPPTPCIGDCTGVGAVGIADLITGVNVALGRLPVSACSALDVDGNATITINEMIAAVSNSLHGCQ